MKNVNLRLGTEMRTRQLVEQMGDSALGLLVNGGNALSDTYIIVARVEDGIRLVDLEIDDPPATKSLDLKGPDGEHQPLHFVLNPQDVINAYQSRYYLICKAYGLRH